LLPIFRPAQSGNLLLSLFGSAKNNFFNGFYLEYFLKNGIYLTDAEGRGIKMKEHLIVCDPEILNGKPIIKGTRISVGLIMQCIASGMTKEDILQGYPTLTPEGLEAALDFAARQLQGEEVRFFENRP
jgi:uncharacterized protein (DUF433 family)